MLNSPGAWDFMISYTQRNPEAKLLASETFYSLKELGLSCWLDVKMERRDESAMEEGVRNSTVVIAIVTEGDGTAGTSYFERPVCLKELRWAVSANKSVQPVLRVEDKHRVGEFLALAPADLKFLGSIDWIDMNRGAVQYWNVGISLICRTIEHKTSTMSERNGSGTSCEGFSSAVSPEVLAFLQELRMERFANQFANFGVNVFDDLEDVDEETLASFGCSGAEQKRFLRKRPATGAPQQRPESPSLGSSWTTLQPVQLSEDVDALRMRVDYEGLTRLLSNGTIEERCKAAGAFSYLTVTASSSTAGIVSAGGVPPLVQLLRDGTDEGRTHAAEALANLVALDSAERRQAIVEAEGIPAIVQLLTTGTNEGKTNAAAALRNLGAYDTVRLMADAGGIPGLTQLLLEGTEEGKANAAAALANLANDETLRQPMAEAGSIPAL
eukprot:gene25161-30706_t